MTHRRTSPKIFSVAYELRHHPTEAEEALWQELRAAPLKHSHFRRQHGIGPYIVDFCAAHQKLIIEVDGSQHNEQQEYDSERTAFFEAKGYRVMRFSNAEVLNDRQRVMEGIMKILGKVEMD